MSDVVDEPYLRSCRPCNAIHVYENPFRMAALQAGLELEPGTSPPVLHRINGLKPPMYRRLGDKAEPRFDVVRNYVRFYGPARIRDAAEFLDAPQADVERHWPDDVVEVRVNGRGAPSSGGRAQRRYLLAEDMEALAAAAGRGGGWYASAFSARTTRSCSCATARCWFRTRNGAKPCGPSSAGRAPWSTVANSWACGVPGRRGSVCGWSSNRGSGSTKPVRTALEEQAERLAAHRDVTLAGLAFD